ATCTASGSGTLNASSANKPDSSKKYGNGSTAAQVANSHGAPAGTQVYGPGNSQPHKVLDCKRHHWVDVHAVKSYSSEACTSTSSSTQTGGSTNTTTNTGGTTVSGSTSNTTSSTSTATGHTSVVAPAASTAKGNSAAANSSNGHAASAAGGVLGVTASGGSKPAGGVLGVIASTGSGVLPFTGFPLWIAALAALALIAFGLALRRNARATV